MQKMTDVETKTPNKRKSLPNKQGGPSSPKKAKLEKTLPKGKSPKKNVSPPKADQTPTKHSKLQKTPKKASNFEETSLQNSNKKDKKNGQIKINSPKKVTPFAGTSDLELNVEKKKQKKVKHNDGDKKRKGQFYQLSEQVRNGDKAEALKSIVNKIKAIEGRGELTKTGKRKIKLLNRLKNICEGKSGQIKQEKVAHGKSESTKRRERKKKAKLESKLAKEGKPGNDVSVEKKTVSKTNNNPSKKVKPEQKQVAKKVEKIDSDDESDESEEMEEELTEAIEAEEESDSEEEADINKESGSDEEEVADNDSEEGEEDSESDEEAEESEEESEEDSPPQVKQNNSEKISLKVKNQKQSTDSKDKNRQQDTKQQTSTKSVNLEKLQAGNLIVKNQKRFVLFVGNIPYDTTKQDLSAHFQKCGEIRHIRIPTEKKSNKPRGFAYVEVANEDSYQKSMSMHHSFLKGRRINVLYTQGGKKKGADKKKEIKEKNFKLHAMRNQGLLAGSKKITQKRSFRRAKHKFKKDNETQG